MTGCTCACKQPSTPPVFGQPQSRKRPLMSGWLGESSHSSRAVCEPTSVGGTSGGRRQGQLGTVLSWYEEIHSNRRGAARPDGELMGRRRKRVIRYTANLPNDAGRATDGRAESGPCCSTSPKTKAEETDFRCHAKAYQGKTGLMMPSCPVQLRLLIVHPEIANAYQAATHATTEIHDA